jgi:hypothetical protein
MNGRVTLVILFLQFFYTLTDTRINGFTSSTVSISGYSILFLFESVYSVYPRRVLVSQVSCCLENRQMEVKEHNT